MENEQFIPGADCIHMLWLTIPYWCQAESTDSYFKTLSSRSVKYETHSNMLGCTNDDLY